MQLREGRDELAMPRQTSAGRRALLVRDAVRTAISSAETLPVLLTVNETAGILRTTRRAVYTMIARQQLPGLTRLGRRVLFRTDALLDWLDQKRAPSPKE
jgi:excisionase family DNA binding protein